MKSNGSNPNNGTVPRAGINKFAAGIGKRKGAAATDINAPVGHRVIHEKESSLPETLVPGLVPSVPPLHAAAGDDDLMSEPPAKNAPKGKPPRAKPGDK